MHRTRSAWSSSLRQSSAQGDATGTPTPPDTRVSFTVVTDGRDRRIAGIQYSFIGPPLGGPAMNADASSPEPRAHQRSWLQRRANVMLTRAVRNGRGPSFMRLLTVHGRRTGKPRTTPVVPVFDGGRTWVVSPFGEVAWVRNARATGRVELQRGDHQQADGQSRRANDEQQNR